jgi:glycosyltransferase involved in cell wall biosynthesis
MRYLLHAPNVHAGGGRRLLQDVLAVMPSPFSWMQLDERSRADLLVPSGLDVHFVKPSLLSRLLAEWRVRKECRPQDVVLCFHGLPPLFRLRGQAVVFVQNRLLVESLSLGGYPYRVRLRLTAERWWLRLKKGHATHYMVQTPSMAVLMRRLVPAETRVSVMPFAPANQPAARVSELPDSGKDFQFVYIASGEAHKNHFILIEAWRLLKEAGLRPSLGLTLDGTKDASLCVKIEALARDNDLAVTNLGWLKPHELASLYEKSGALIYPSTGESLGLPLVEARDAGLPVLAAELDYVRDVVEPAETFDPGSPLSIARAVRRHLNSSDKPVVMRSAAQFLSEALR